MTVIKQAPRLGYMSNRDRRAAADEGDDAPEMGVLRVADANGRAIRMVPPGADVNGQAAWRIGTAEPNGPWGRQDHVIVIGNRNDALAEARRMWARYQNGREGYVLNGWLAIVSPETKMNGGAANGVTRMER
jgi:hypothetical protein